MSITVVGDFDAEATRRGLVEIELHTRPQWRAAHEVSQYVARYLDADLQRQCGTARSAQDMAADVAYAVSELMENAAKYSLPGTVELRAGLQNDAVVVTLSHAVANVHAQRYQERATHMTQHDPTDLLLATVERNALREGESSSGLGLLSLMSDYGARLGWSFEQADDDAAAVRVMTQAHLPLRH